MRKTLLVVAIVTLNVGLARALFIVDTDPGGIKFYNGDANKDVASYVGFVGGEKSGPMVTVDTVGNVDTGAGYSNIKPIHSGNDYGLLTSIIFTPFDADLFGDFSFRGQLLEAAKGELKLTVQDNQGNAPQVFNFSGLGSESDFARLGIISLDGCTIQWVKLESNFKEQKQNEFSYARAIPDGGTTAALLGSALAAVAFIRRRA